MSSSYSYPRGLSPDMREALLRLPLDQQKHLIAFYIDEKKLPQLAAERGVSVPEIVDFHLDALLAWRQKARMLSEGRPKFTPTLKVVQHRLRTALRQQLHR